MADVTAYVTMENGQLVLHDPAAEAMVAVVAEHNRKIALQNCQKLYDQNLSDIQRFRRRFDEKGYRPDEYCIVIINVDDIHGRHITDVIMPGYNWQPIRDQGATPVARGITDRKLIQKAIEIIDCQTAEELRTLEYAVVVITSATAKVYAV